MGQISPEEMQPNGKAAGELQSDHWEVCYRTAEHLYARSVYKEAFAWYKKASSFPDCNPIVFFELGYLYQHGEGVDLDCIEALKWYEKAASLGVPQAMYNLAYFYQNGLVVDQDIQKAAQLLRDATSLMDRLQLERSSYDVWKAKYDAQLAEAQSDAKKEQVRSENLELQNRELNIELSAARRDFQRLEQEAAQYKNALQKSEKQCEILAARTQSAETALQQEQKARKESEFIASTRQSQMEEQLHSAEEFIAYLVKSHNESFEQVQSSYTAQMDRLQQDYKTEFTSLQQSKEQLSGQNSELSHMLKQKTLELGSSQKALQQLQKTLEQEKKMKMLGFILAGIFGVFACVLFV